VSSAAVREEAHRCFEFDEAKFATAIEPRPTLPLRLVAVTALVAPLPLPAAAAPGQHEAVTAARGLNRGGNVFAAYLKREPIQPMSLDASAVSDPVTPLPDDNDLLQVMSESVRFANAAGVAGKGVKIELDASAVAGLVNNRGALMQELRLAIDEIAGPLDVTDDDEFELRYEQSRSPAEEALSKVATGRSVRDAAGAAAAVRAPVPMLTHAELSVFELDAVGGSEGELKKAADSAAAELGSDGPSGLLGKLLRGIDVGFYMDFAGDGEDDASALLASDGHVSDFQPLCLVCIAAQRAMGDDEKLDLGPSVCRQQARSSLDRWRSNRHLSRLNFTKSLTADLATRQTSKASVASSQMHMADVVKHATGSAESWAKARYVSSTPEPLAASGLPPLGAPGRGVKRSPSPPKERAPSPRAGDDDAGPERPMGEGLLWGQPCQSITSEHARIACCELLWRRLHVFLASVAMPTTADHAGYLEELRVLVCRSRLVSRALFFRWLHLCGAKVVEARDMFRVVMFVRMELHVSRVAWLRWGRLPEQRIKGWRVSEE
jgi:hypothetical protein